MLPREHGRHRRLLSRIDPDPQARTGILRYGEVAGAVKPQCRRERPRSCESGPSRCRNSSAGRFTTPATADLSTPVGNLQASPVPRLKMTGLTLKMTMLNWFLPHSVPARELRPSNGNSGFPTKNGI